ncbi:MAG: hypothetical protein KDI88_06810 [Gammaproteobacteria bacterium]|nr:hypothetical protein [Gammaproteobacteria bacterium]
MPVSELLNGQRAVIPDSENPVIDRRTVMLGLVDSVEVEVNARRPVRQDHASTGRASLTGRGLLPQRATRAIRKIQGNSCTFPASVLPLVMIESNQIELT